MIAGKPVVCAVIVPHHLPENRKYLDLCLRSLVLSKCDFEEKCSGEVRVNIYCLSPYELYNTFEYGDNIKFIHDETLSNATLKMQRGASLGGAENATTLFFVSDDVYVSRSTISDLLEAAMHKGPFIVNPMSNSEFGTKVKDYLEVSPTKLSRPVTLTPNMSYEEGLSVYETLIQYSVNPYFRMGTPWNAFYCTLIPTQVWDALGGLDPKLDVRHNDVDFCKRAADIGVPCLISTGSFAFHFGSKTIYKAHSPDEFLKADAEWEMKHGEGRRKEMSDVNFSALKGKVLKSITGLDLGSESVKFITADGKTYLMYYVHECCATCDVEEVIGDVEDLIGSEILLAEEVVQRDENPEGVKIPEYQDSFTWTFYKLSTIKGSVTIRWYGSSNGYYSESVYFEEQEK